MDCTGFVTLVAALTRGQCRQNMPIRLHATEAGADGRALYLGPTKEVYKLLVSVPCDHRGQWVFDVGESLFIGLHTTGVRVQSLEEWIVIATGAMHDWCSEHGQHRHCSDTLSALQQSVARVLRINQAMGIFPQCTIMLPRSCYNMQVAASQQVKLIDCVHSVLDNEFVYDGQTESLVPKRS